MSADNRERIGRFTPYHEEQLAWRYGDGAALIERVAVTIPDTGLRGKGHRGTKGAMAGGSGPSEGAMVKFGRIERALHDVPDMFRHSLALGYGEAGALVTLSGGTRANLRRRWIAVAHLTPIAKLEAETWPGKGALSRPWKAPKLKRGRLPDEREIQGGCGPTPQRWVRWLIELARKNPNGSPGKMSDRVEREAWGILTHAGQLFAGAYDAITHGERAIERTARLAFSREVSRVPAGLSL